MAKLTFIPKEIYDFKKPIIVNRQYIYNLLLIGEINKEQKRLALKGKEITALGYKIKLRK